MPGTEPELPWYALSGTTDYRTSHRSAHESLHTQYYSFHTNTAALLSLLTYTLPSTADVALPFAVACCACASPWCPSSATSQLLPQCTTPSLAPHHPTLAHYGRVLIVCSVCCCAVRCQSTLKKAKVQSHSWQCSSRSFSCIDCGVSFTPHSFSSHTQCVSEAEKYQGKLYKGKKHQTSSQQQQHPPAPLQQQQQHVHSAAHKRAAEETKEAQDDGEEENGSSVQQQQQQAKRSKQTTAEEPEEEKKEQPQEQSIAELLPATLQSEVSHTLH